MWELIPLKNEKKERKADILYCLKLHQIIEGQVERKKKYVSNSAKCPNCSKRKLSIWLWRIGEVQIKKIKIKK